MCTVAVSVGESTALAPKVAWPAAVLTMSVPELRSGLRTAHETVVVTGALPIKNASRLPTVLTAGHVTVATLSSVTVTGPLRRTLPELRSEERRVGKEGELTVTESE